MLRVYVLSDENFVLESVVDQVSDPVHPLSIARKVNLLGHLVIRILDPEQIKLAIAAKVSKLRQGWYVL